MKRIQDIDVSGKKVLLRTDFDVPVEDGRITEEFSYRQIDRLWAEIILVKFA